MKPCRLSIVRINLKWPQSEEVAATGEAEANEVAGEAVEAVKVVGAVQVKEEEHPGARDTPQTRQIAVVTDIMPTEIKLSTV